MHSKRKSLWFVGPLLAASVFGNASVFADQTELAAQWFDCLIVPYLIVDVGSSVNGILKEVNVKRGDLVKKGQILAKLQSDVEEAAVELAQVRAENNISIESAESRQEYFASKKQRMQELFEKKISSKEALERAVTEGSIADFDLLTAKIEKRLARVELKHAKALLAQRTIISPMDGLVIARELSPGAYIYEQEKLVTIAQIDVLNVEVYLPIWAFRLIDLEMQATVKPVEDIGGEHIANVTIVDSVFDAASGSFGVRLELQNTDHSIPSGIKCSLNFIPSPS